MRTTINLPDELLRAAKREALETDRTLSAVVADALRLARTKAAESKAAPKIKLPTFKGTGVRAGVDVNNTARLLDIMDGLDEPS